jgi:hypothetical protein
MRFLNCCLGRILAAAMIVTGATGLASAQSFQISQNGQNVGTAGLSVKPAGGGFSSTSWTKIKMPGLDYSFSENESLDGGYQLKTSQLDGSVNGTKATVNAVPQGQQLDIKINANGKVINTPLAFHPQAVFFPDFDPAALQMVLSVGALHNNRDLWAIIPKQAGSVAAMRIATKPDEQGILNGQQSPIHHITVTTDADTIEIFSNPSNQLMQAEWSEEGFAMVRQGFVLTPSAKPRTPPPAQQQQPPAQPNAQAPQPQ